MKDYRITKFYLGIDIHPRGHNLRDVLAMDNGYLSRNHELPQWLFPLDGPRRLGGPFLSKDEIRTFRANLTMRKNFLDVFKKYLAIFGLQYEGGVIGLSNKTDPNTFFTGKWMQPGSHAYVFITRIARCLRLLNFHEEAKQLLDILFKVNERSGYKLIDRQTLDVWSEIRQSIEVATKA
jgi:hypothetical protein